MGKATKLFMGRAPPREGNMADILSTTGMLDYLTHGSVVDTRSIFRGKMIPNPGVFGLECALPIPILRQGDVCLSILILMFC